MHYILAETVGGLAFPVALWKFQIKSRKWMLLTNVAVSAMIAAQFVLLAQASGACMGALTATSSLLAALLGPRIRWGHRMMIAVAGCLLMLAIDHQALSLWWEWLPVAAFMDGRVSETFLNQYRLRFSLLPSHLMWMTYGVITGAWATVALEIAAFFSNSVGIWRLYRSGYGGTDD